MGIFSAIGKGLATGLDFVSAVAKNPINAVLHPVSATQEIEKLRTTGTNAERLGYIKAVGVTTAINTAATLVPVAKVGQVAKSTFQGLSTTGKIVTGATAPVVAAAVVTNPSLIYSAPQKVVNFQTNAGQLLANPSVEGAKTLIKENPVIAGVVGAGAVATVGLGGANLISGYLNREAIKENTKAVIDSKTTLPTETITKTQIPSTIPTNTETPKVPETVEVKKSSGKRRKHKKQTINPQNIVQKTNILIQNKNDKVIRLTEKLKY